MIMLCFGCATIKPWEKEYLLHPLMDDAGIGQLNADMLSTASGEFEKLGSAGAGSAGATSCPTCGG